MRASRLLCLTTLAILALSSQASVLAQSGQPPQTGKTGQQQPTPGVVFRSAVTLVPVDVRVTDKNGKPITDLKAEDFTLVEDGVRQEIRHFALQTFAASDAPPPGGALTATASTPAGLTLRKDAVSFEPQTNRIFLIVLGRGRLQEPSKAIDALIQFVNERLLPRDQVAVFAYNRATTFTTDHQNVANLLQKFRSMHEQVDYEVELAMSGLAAIYGSKMLPKSLQGKIDAMFAGSTLLASERLDPKVTANKQLDKDITRQTDILIQKEQELAKADMTALANAASSIKMPNLTAWTELDEIQTQMFADLSLEDFVTATAQTLQDLGNIYAAISYLKNFEGEKHLVFFTEKGLTLSRTEEDERLASIANDARVVLDTVETGGIYVGQPGNNAGVMPDGRWNQTFAFKTLRTIAELTGGVSSIAESGKVAMDRLNDVTRVTYSLGFYPANPNWNGDYRNVTVKVNRPGTQVYFRHGYYATKELAAFNRREFITKERMQAAAGFRRTLDDIKLRVNAKQKRTPDGNFEVTVDVDIDPKKLAFRSIEGVHVGEISIAVFCFNEKGAGLGGNMQNADLKLTDDVYKRVLNTGVPYKASIPVPSGVRTVRVIVYDFKADLIGSADCPVL